MGALMSHKVLGALAIFVLALLGCSPLMQSGQAPGQARPLLFRVKLAPKLGSDLESGRLIVLLSSEKEPKQELQPGFGRSLRSVWIAAEEVHNLHPGETFNFDPDRLAWPMPLSQAPPGDYQLMAVLDVNHHYAYNGLNPGDLRSPVLQLKSLNPKQTLPLELTLTERVAPLEVKLPVGIELFDFTSRSLAQFWGRPIHMRGVVALPPSYARSRQRYATAYLIPGFTTDLVGVTKLAPKISGKGLTEGIFPEMIHVVLDNSCPGGAHEFADSVNNGPWGRALTKELIPYLESKYRMDAKPNGRLLSGGSSGGWAALWLLLNYPEIFGGAWPMAPDPADFRNFYGPNLRIDPPENMYQKPDGRPRMWMREGGREVAPVEEVARQEQVLGDYGGAFASFEWVFSPRGNDGRPQPLFDRETGAVNPEVAKAWQRYEIAEIIRRDADRFRPLLDGKIHLTVGTADTFHLDEPARLLEETLKQARIRASFTYVEGRGHFDLMELVNGEPAAVRGGLLERIFREMEAVARPR
jgi:S-formylglutathione hydrolase FrmB